MALSHFKFRIRTNAETLPYITIQHFLTCCLIWNFDKKKVYILLFAINFDGTINIICNLVYVCVKTFEGSPAKMYVSMNRKTNKL